MPLLPRGDLLRAEDRTPEDDPTRPTLTPEDLLPDDLEDLILEDDMLREDLPEELRVPFATKGTDMSAATMAKLMMRLTAFFMVVLRPRA